MLPLSPPVSLLPLPAGERCGCWWHRIDPLLPALQALHPEADQEAGDHHAQPQGLPLHQGTGFPVHQVCVLSACLCMQLEWCVYLLRFSLRYCQPPKDFWNWFEPYINDEEVGAPATQVTSSENLDCTGCSFLCRIIIDGYLSHPVLSLSLSPDSPSLFPLSLSLFHFSHSC